MQWALDQNVYSDRRYRLVRGQLSDLENLSADYDLLLLVLDLGQPVPLESLRRASRRRPGLCAFVQPTPGQLLALEDFEDWSAVAWDGASFDRVARRLDELAGRADSRIKREAFVEATRAWLKRYAREPGRLVWMNPPENWKGPVHATLDRDRAMLSVGSLQSPADWKLPISGAEDLFELRRVGDAWSFQGLSSRAVYEGDAHSSLTGDQIRIGDFVFMLSSDTKVEEMVGVAQRLDSQAEAIAPEAGKSLQDVCRELLYTHVVGELVIDAGLRSGAIYY